MTLQHQLKNEVCSSYRGNRQTNGQNDYRNPVAHARRRLMTDWILFVGQSMQRGYENSV